MLIAILVVLGIGLVLGAIGLAVADEQGRLG